MLDSFAINRVVPNHVISQTVADHVRSQCLQVQHGVFHGPPSVAGVKHHPADVGANGFDELQQFFTAQVARVIFKSEFDTSI